MIQEIKLNLNKSEFNQFAFISKIVKKYFYSHNFLLKECHITNGIKCLNDEISLNKSLLQELYDYYENSLIIELFRFLLNLSGKTITSHMCFMFFQKENV